jgi:hypothetical protein
MTPREIIAKSWLITTKHKNKLLFWGALDAFILMISAMIFVMYQTYVLGSFFRNGEIASWKTVVGIISTPLQGNTAVTILLIVLLVIYLILWAVIPRFATAALIGLSAKIHCGDEPKGGIVLAFFNFFALLELAAALGLIGAKTLFSLWSLAVRYMSAGDGSGIFTLSAILIIFWCVSFIFHFLFTFAEEAIVIRKFGVFKALGQSFKLVLSYLTKVILIAVLLLIIILRIVVNAIIIFLIPSLVMGLGFLFMKFMPEIISFGISGGIGLLIVVVASYFLGYVTVFKHTVWTITYLELSKEKELDVIDTEETKEAEDTKETKEAEETKKTEEVDEEPEANN